MGGRRLKNGLFNRYVIVGISEAFGVAIKKSHVRWHMIVLSIIARHRAQSVAGSSSRKIRETDATGSREKRLVIVSSGCKGTARHLHNSTHMRAGVSIDVHHILCAWCGLAESVDTHTLCAETLCVTGDGAARRQESTFCFADCQPLSTADSVQGQGIR